MKHDDGIYERGLAVSVAQKINFQNFRHIFGLVILDFSKKHGGHGNLNFPPKNRKLQG
jgi:hypothetical protein